MAHKTYTDYFFDKSAFNTLDGGYVPLTVNHDAPAKPLAIPALHPADSEDANHVEYTVTARTGEVQMLPGKPTKTWGYDANVLGQTIVFKEGQDVTIHLKNDLPELTTFHWHGLNVPGPYVDGGCHAPVYPGETKDIQFTVKQPAATLWLHAHPCPETAVQVYHGLAAMVLVQDAEEAKLPLPRNYGVDDIPVVLQDRHFNQDNQWDYQADYDPDGVQGPTAVINGMVNPYFDVTTTRVRLRLLDGANRREWRLHFGDNHEFAQVASDGGILPSPVYFTHLMLTCAERAEIVVDFSDYAVGDTVALYSDDVPLLTFRIKAKNDNGHGELPEKLADIPRLQATPGLPIHKVVMSGMDEAVEIDGKKFDMQRIDSTQDLGVTEIWDVTNTNDMHGGMIHPFHIHGGQFQIISRDGHDPYPNEYGWKDTVGVNPGEHVRFAMKFDFAGVYMYHCHILEHEDGGMMAQIEVIDPSKPRPKYKLMDHHTLMTAFAKERGVSMDEMWIGAMNSYKKMGMHM